MVWLISHYNICIIFYGKNFYIVGTFFLLKPITLKKFIVVFLNVFALKLFIFIIYYIKILSRIFYHKRKIYKVDRFIL